MSKRISELPPIENDLLGDELLEISVPDEESPTGYSSKAVTVEELRGNPELPYRFEIFQSYITLDGDNEFELVFDKTIFTNTGLYVNNVDDNGKLAMAVVKFNAVAAFRVGQFDDFISYGFLNSDALITLGNRENGSEGDADENLGRVGTFNSTNDNTISTLFDYTSSAFVTNELYSTVSIQPVRFYEKWSPGSSTPNPDQLAFVFKALPPVSQTLTAKNMVIKGYIDMNSLFSEFNVPV
jgi:hypothetical protein